MSAEPKRKAPEEPDRGGRFKRDRTESLSIFSLPSHERPLVEPHGYVSCHFFLHFFISRTKYPKHVDRRDLLCDYILSSRLPAVSFPQGGCLSRKHTTHCWSFARFCSYRQGRFYYLTLLLTVPLWGICPIGKVDLGSGVGCPGTHLLDIATSILG